MSHVFNAIRVGDWQYLDLVITPHELYNNWGFRNLFELNTDELRILRNSFYAKYGYKFSSRDLQNYFGQFIWYNGTKEDVESELSDIEKMYIAIIRRIESNYPQYLNEDIIGYWSVEDGIEPYVRSLSDYTWWYYLRTFEHFGIYPNGTFFYYNWSIMATDEDVIYGLWSLKNNEFTINSISNDVSVFRDVSAIENNINQYIIFSKYKSSNETFLETNFTRDQKRWVRLSRDANDFMK
jgi:hypothetical protein